MRRYIDTSIVSVYARFQQVISPLPGVAYIFLISKQGIYSTQLAVAMICDISITFALVYYLNGLRSGFRL